MSHFGGKYDIVVVGAGHAGIEAALAGARLGCTVLCLCTCLDAVGNMPCNPSVGGTAKGQLVREIDALGGEMARAADATGIQFRMLNRGKGPAVFSPRAQVDRIAYRRYMKHALENCPGLTLMQGEAAKVLTDKGCVFGVELASGLFFEAKAVVLATGTYLKGKTFAGEFSRQSGPDGMLPADFLSVNLINIGLPLRRFKTGTPARLDSRTIDYSKMEVQYGEEEGEGFSFGSGAPSSKAVCYLLYTNERTHGIIRSALDRSPLFTGVIEGVGPRYCPSIEDKVVRFPQKIRHQLFLEPCGLETSEIYLQGLSTSLPEDVQIAMLHSIEGLENVSVMRFGYAIEYDCLDPLCLTAALETKAVSGLFAAGQLCGSSGYEEAAGQGLVAGINAAHKVLGRAHFTLKRTDGYIGTLIDDLVTKGTNEPYRMMTSRSEYRLTARQDNADFRLMGYGRELGLVAEDRYKNMERKYALAEEEIQRLKKTVIAPSDELNAILGGLGTSTVVTGISLYDLMKRPQVGYDDLTVVDLLRPVLSKEVIEQVEINIKYEGYIRRGLREIEEQKRLEDRSLPENIDYMAISLLRVEARQKLSAIRPKTLGQAGRISGVSPADIGGLIVYLSSMEGKKDV
ncbi:MAG: tRNA uridine-5-carboxymethylaminomethyl(34) synthesis enzyme MnmG [Clostridiaceae bacterium]|nr:tRNA uridine-5-carboxymethylaminomethyl(34) synthesis enzyme MnmG [Clostridiaceae bacterium]